MKMINNPKLCASTIAKLKAENLDERRRVVESLIPMAAILALADQHTSRLVQELVSAAGYGQVRLLAVLAPRTRELYESLHGNHVLTKIIEVMPSAALQPVIKEIEGQATVVARHRFGCRVLERLAEHCTSDQLRGIQAEIIADAEALCRHQYGNFVVQHLFEHVPNVRNHILEKMLPVMPMLAMHRTASHAVQRTLDHCEEMHEVILAVFLQATTPNSLPEMACSRYGSFVVEQLATVVSPSVKDEVRSRLYAHQDVLAASQFGRRVAERFELPLPFRPVAHSGSV